RVEVVGSAGQAGSNTGTEKGGLNNAGEENGRSYNQRRDVVAESSKNIIEGNAAEPKGTPDNGNGERPESADSSDKTGDIIPADQIPFRFLGFDAGAYYVMPKNQ